MEADHGTTAANAHGAAAWLIGAGALVLAILAGYYVSSGPSWLSDPLDLQSPVRLIVLTAGAGFLAMIFSRPDWGLLMLVPLFYTNASEPLVERYGITSPLQVVLLATAAAAVVPRVPRGEYTRRELVLDPLLVPLGLYGFVLFASSVGAARISLSDTVLLEHLKGILIVVVLTNLITSLDVLRRVIWTIILSGAFLGTISVYQILTGSYGEDFSGFGRVKIAEIVLDVRHPRIAGSLGDPNFYAQILVMLVPFALYRLWDEPSLLCKAFAGFAMTVCVAAIVFTYSRGGAIALMIVLLLALLHKRVRPKYFVLGLLVAVPIALNVPQGFSGRLDTLAQLAPAASESIPGREDSSFRDRRRLMTAAWEMFSDHPWLGVGAGNFSDRFDAYADHIGSAVSSFEKFGRQHFPHNLYLQIAAETGIAGLAAFALIISATLMSLWKAYRTCIRSGATHSAHMVASIFLALTAYLITSLFLHGACIRYLWLLVAISASAAQVLDRKAQEVSDV